MQRFRFPTSDALAAALAAAVAERLRAALAEKEAVNLVVSGGTTPRRFFQALSAQALPWERVTVSLADERLVPLDHPRRNQGLVRAHLLQDRAAAATFAPLVDEAGEPSLAPPSGPIDVLVAGMGEDGHTASIFPDDPALPPLLDQPGIGRATPPKQPEARLTRTLPDLMGAAAIFLHIEGAAKQGVLAVAQCAGPVAAMPIRGLLRTGRVAVYTTA